MLTEITQDIWQAEHDLYLMGGAVWFGCRMSIIRLSGADLMLYSPIPIDDVMAAQLAQLGDVRYVVAPNGFHHKFIGDVLGRYPKASLLGSPAVAKKRPDLSFELVEEANPPKAWRGQLEVLVVRGAPKMDEIVLLHRASRTLILCDLVFNIHRTKGWLTPAVLRMVARVKVGEPGQSRIWRYLVKKPALAQDSALRLLDWGFDRVVPAHGVVITEDARGTMERALAPMLS